MNRFVIKLLLLLLVSWLHESRDLAQPTAEIARKQGLGLSGHGFLYLPMKEWVEPTVAWAQVQSKVSGKKSLEQELMQLQQAVDEAETKKDIATLDRLLSDNYIFTAPNGTISDKKQLIDDTKNAEAGPEQTINYDETKVYAYGTTAVVSYLLIVKGQDRAGKDYTNRYRNTVIWVKQQKQWRMAAIHVSRIRAY